jgi:hypothetical protein
MINLPLSVKTKTIDHKLDFSEAQAYALAYASIKKEIQNEYTPATCSIIS